MQSQVTDLSQQAMQRRLINHRAGEERAAIHLQA
jgi:hypothetical protein